MAQGLIEYSNVSDLVIDYDPAGHWQCKTSSQTLPFFAILPLLIPMHCSYSEASCAKTEELPPSLILLATLLVYTDQPPDADRASKVSFADCTTPSCMQSRGLMV